jgi:ribosomal protein S18 acetylase RimI-like enzyme
VTLFRHSDWKIDLQVLATLPEYRGQGIGSRLLEIGLAEGRNAGLDEFYLEASDDGHDLYEKFGFRDLERIPIDLVQYGGNCEAQVRTMRILPN